MGNTLEGLGSAGTNIAAPRSGPGKQIVVGAVGNVLEWYDFAVYGYFAAIFGKNFFPGESPLVALASAFSVFAAAFLMRPIGGVLFGHIGDRFGRKRALLVSAGLMTVSTVAIGLLPTYAMVGAAATLPLIILRLVQGVSVGGEYATSVVFLVEQSHPRRRGLIGSAAAGGASLGTVLGSAVGTLIASMMDQASLESWGWRVPFLLGLGLGVAAFALRTIMPDDRNAVSRQSQGLPLAVAFRTEWRNILRGTALCASYAVSFYLMFVYLTTYMQQVDGLPTSRALQINTLTMLVMLCLTPCFAILSDRVGRRPVLIGATLGMAVLAWPLFNLLDQPNQILIALGQFGFAVLVAAYCGVIPAALVEMFAGETRCTALSISYNLAFAVLGGTAPMVAVFLVNAEHWPLGPGVYLAATGAVSFIAALTMRER